MTSDQNNVTTRSGFTLGDNVQIVSENGPPGTDIPTVGIVVGFANYGFIIVQISRDVQGEYLPQDLTII
jgi:hypothetical protein